MALDDDARDEMYVRGQRAAYAEMLTHCMRELGYCDPPSLELARLIKEREEVLAGLRDACNELGDNDWPDDLHLGDALEMHLVRNMRELAAQAKRYRYVQLRNPLALMAVAWATQEPKALAIGDDPDAALDVAMRAEKFEES